MKLRNQLLTLSLATVMVPWFGWKLVQELETFLRAGQESALGAAASTLAQALSLEAQTVLFARQNTLTLRSFDAKPALDGYIDDWTEPGSTARYRSIDGELQLRVLAGRYGGQDFLFLRVDGPVTTDPSPGPGSELDGNGLILHLRSARGLVQFKIPAAAPGPLLIDSQSAGEGQLGGHLSTRANGYDVELALAPTSRAVDLSVGAVDRRLAISGVITRREAGTLADGKPVRWLVPTVPDVNLADWLQRVTPPYARAWVVDREGWVVAESGPVSSNPVGRPSWAERFLYRLVAGSEMEILEERPEVQLRFQEPLVERALNGEVAQHWGQEPASAVVRNTVAVPIHVAGERRGAVVMEANTDGLLLVTNRALGRLLLVTLFVTIALAAGLWFLASRLTRRVQALSGAVSLAMEDAAQPQPLPLTQDRDELGELARNNSRLLKAVAEYTRYLRNLAGRLSHELKTPLAITRSSLDNLANQPLNEDARRYADRAREGLERQAAIVRAMSQASRLEAAAQTAEWEQVDLVQLVTHCVEAYRGVHPGRTIDLALPGEPVNCVCAPDLLAQALDKLVDNAVELTGPDDVVEVSLVPKGNYRHLHVMNTGTCLPDTLRDQLFDSLVSVREPGSGGLHLGLGLHIVRLVSEAHGGTVEARNLEHERGVVFTVSLPAGPLPRL